VPFNHRLLLSNKHFEIEVHFTKVILVFKVFLDLLEIRKFALFIEVIISHLFEDLILHLVMLDKKVTQELFPLTLHSSLGFWI
jgi:hypothetical protein